MDAGTQLIYENLKALARSRGKDYYSNIAPLAGLSHRSPRFHRLLDDISAGENGAKRPLVSAVVVLKGQTKRQTIPGSGFFTMAKRLGLYHGDDVSFWNEEVERVFHYWSTH